MKSTTVFFDLETGGVEDHHPDIQIAAVAIRDWQEIATFERKIEFDASKADPAALKINSFNPNVWKEHAVPEPMAVNAFAAFLEAYRVIERISRHGIPFLIARLSGHNVARFDAPRLLRMFQRTNRTFLPADAFMPLDTMQLALWRFMGAKEQPKNMKLETLCEFFDISTEGAHDALTDVRLTVELARHLLDW